jgi:hypothetical protein
MELFASPPPPSSACLHVVVVKNMDNLTFTCRSNLFWKNLRFNSYLTNPRNGTETRVFGTITASSNPLPRIGFYFLTLSEDFSLILLNTESHFPSPSHFELTLSVCRSVSQSVRHGVLPLVGHMIIFYKCERSNHYGVSSHGRALSDEGLGLSAFVLFFYLQWEPDSGSACNTS